MDDQPAFETNNDGSGGEESDDYEVDSENEKELCFRLPDRPY